MRLKGLFRPRPTISDQEVASGLRWLTWEGMVSMGFGSITTSGFLAAFALALGANILQIGILAALPFLGQVLQIPTILLVERLRQRKAIAVTTWFSAQLLWLPIALIPLFLDVPSAGAISLLLGAMAVRSVLNGVTNGAWNSWVRDLVPQHILGRFFARRQALANLTAVVFGLAAAFFVDYWRGHAPGGAEALGFTFPLLLGALTLGLASPLFMTLMPEPLMQSAPGPKPSLFSTLAAPIRDRNYKCLLRFLFLWGFALNLATPFFAVYMLQQLGLPLSAVIALTALSQASNIAFLRVWGPLADRFGSKAVLSVCASLYLLVILGWTFTTMPERYFMTIPLLVILHILAGVAAAGVSLTTFTIGMKIAPPGQATSYLAAAGLATSLGYGLGPLLGGRLADFFSVRQLGLTFTWGDPTGSLQVPALSLAGFDFLFGIAFVLGLITLSFLTALREEGEASREVVLEALLAPMRQFSRPMSSAPGLNLLTQFPYGLLRRVPLPGLDVALGVTAHQLANTARVATTAAAQGRRSTARVVKALEGALVGVWKARQANEVDGAEVARQAARGAIHATKDAPLDVGQLAYQAVLGVVRALRRARVDPAEAIRGAGYGVVQGAGEVGADIGKAAQQAVEAAREAAHQSGLSEEVAAAQAAQGALEAAEAIGPEAVAEVEASLPREVLTALTEQSLEAPLQQEDGGEESSTR